MNSKDSQPKKRKSPFRFFFYDFFKITGAPSALIVMRPKLIYENAQAKKMLKGPAVLIANHESFLDPIKIHFAFWYRRIHLVATSILFETRVKKWFFTKALCIPVNKENFNFGTFRDVSARLSEGAVVGIFPEGGLMDNSEGSVSAFKAGAVLMALKNHAPIIPVYMNKPKKWYNRQILVIGEPITLATEAGAPLPLSAVESIAATLRAKELELCKMIK